MQGATGDGQETGTERPAQVSSNLISKGAWSAGEPALTGEHAGSHHLARWWDSEQRDAAARTSRGQKVWNSLESADGGQLLL